jgi:hypothetical protein
MDYCIYRFTQALLQADVGLCTILILVPVTKQIYHFLWLLYPLNIVLCSLKRSKETFKKWVKETC